MERAVILGAARTPFGRFGGVLSPMSATELGGAAIREAIDRSGVEDGEIQHSIFGIVVQAGVGQIPSRQANSVAGLPFSLTTETLNQVCASGLRSATLAETMIRVGDYELVLTGGMESMSNAPYLLQKARWGARMGDASMTDAMMHDGLLDAFEHVNMVRFGTDGARKNGISREEQDEWSLRSHQRAAAATNAGRLTEEIVGVKVPAKKGETNYVETDEPIRPDTTLEKLAAL
ncbi:MAG TPA: acetyl-CoA C-acyltransferase, partial [Rubrobacteraceae bacterium]|nr:acetyl-CoA C-acyltransferase [Rubrobacteraceae bacterium]